MFFKKKKKKPILLSFVEDRAIDIIKNSNVPNQIITMYFFVFITKNHNLGKTKKQNIDFYNDVSIFELGCFTLAKLIDYLIIKHPEKEIHSYYTDSPVNLKEQGINNEKKPLISDLLLGSAVWFDSVLDWDAFNDNTIESLIKDRIFLYRNSFDESISTGEAVLLKLLRESSTRSNPVKKIENDDFLKSSFEDVVLFHVSLTRFEDTELIFFYKIVDDFLKTYDDYGFDVIHRVRKLKK